MLPCRIFKFMRFQFILPHFDPKCTLLLPLYQPYYNYIAAETLMQHPIAEVAHTLEDYLNQKKLNYIIVGFRGIKRSARVRIAGMAHCGATISSVRCKAKDMNQQRANTSRHARYKISDSLIISPKHIKLQELSYEKKLFCKNISKTLGNEEETGHIALPSELYSDEEKDLYSVDYNEIGNEIATRVSKSMKNRQKLVKNKQMNQDNCQFEDIILQKLEIMEANMKKLRSLQNSRDNSRDYSSPIRILQKQDSERDQSIGIQRYGSKLHPTNAEAKYCSPVKLKRKSEQKKRLRKYLQKTPIRHMLTDEDSDNPEAESQFSNSLYGNISYSIEEGENDHNHRYQPEQAGQLIDCEELDEQYLQTPRMTKEQEASPVPILKGLQQIRRRGLKQQKTVSHRKQQPTYCNPNDVTVSKRKNINGVDSPQSSNRDDRHNSYPYPHIVPIFVEGIGYCIPLQNMFEVPDSYRSKQRRPNRLDYEPDQVIFSSNIDSNDFHQIL